MYPSLLVIWCVVSMTPWRRVVYICIEVVVSTLLLGFVVNVISSEAEFIDP
jgi:hypothetical protein